MVHENQMSAIGRHLEAGKSITPLDALIKWGCFRLGARIWDLRQLGYQIHKEMIDIDNGKRVARYWMAR